MSNLSELIQLYGLNNLPDNLRKERELKRWRDIMAQQRYEQDFLDGFLDAEAKARESDISYEAWLDHKNRMGKPSAGNAAEACIESNRCTRGTA